MEDNMQMQETPVVKKESKAGKWAKTILSGIGMVLLYLAIQGLVGLVAGIIKMVSIMAQGTMEMADLMTKYQEEAMSAEFLTPVATIATLICAIIFVLWYKLKYAKKYSMEKLKGTIKNVFCANNTVMFILAAITCYLIALDVVTVISIVNPAKVEKYSNTMNMVLGGNGVLAFITAVILAPISEECFLRGLVLRKALNNIPAVAAVIMSAVLFGILHTNIVQGLYVLPLGLAAGYAVYKTNSVLPAIFFHFVYNLTPRLLSLLPKEVLNMDWIWVFAPIVPLVALIILWRRNKGVAANDDKS